MPELSIIIPCYLKNEELLQLTKNAIHSFEEADLPSYELILIDDASPMYGGYLRSAADTYIGHKENMGFMKSINDGIKVARGEYLVLSNNDVRVADNFYTVARNILRSDDVISVHPRMCYYDEDLLIGDKRYETGRERWCQSSFFVIKNRGYLFPEHFKGTGGGYDDWYFWSVIRRDGWKTAYTTETCFQHKDSSTTQLVGEGSKEQDYNKQMFINEFGNTPEDHYRFLFPEQMIMPYREEFSKL